MSGRLSHGWIGKAKAKRVDADDAVNMNLRLRPVDDVSRLFHGALAVLDRLVPGAKRVGRPFDLGVIIGAADFPSEGPWRRTAAADVQSVLPELGHWSRPFTAAWA